jgi:hypothetical protein
MSLPVIADRNVVLLLLLLDLSPRNLSSHIPLAKSGLPQTPQNLYLICLVEVLRKLGMSITINRIKAVWENHRVLDESQHGFRGELGTLAAPCSVSSTN